VKVFTIGHSTRSLADPIALLEAHHITSSTAAHPHKLTPFTQIQGERITYPASALPALTQGNLPANLSS
jgi:hypothetical protein